MIEQYKELIWFLNHDHIYTKGTSANENEILNSYKKIMKKIHPDVSPELTRLASIVNEAKEVILKNFS